MEMRWNLLRCHVGHRACNTSELAFIEVYSDVKVSQMGIPLFIEENVVWFDVPEVDI